MDNAFPCSQNPTEYIYKMRVSEHVHVRKYVHVRLRANVHASNAVHPIPLPS